MLAMQVTPPGLTADKVLAAFKSDAPITFLGVAIVTTGLVAAAFAALRRKRTPLLVYFAAFAILYGVRMCIQTTTAYYIFYGSQVFVRISSAINYVVPIPAFLFFDAAGFLRRKAKLATYALLAFFGLLAVATLITGPSNFYQQTNNVL